MKIRNKILLVVLPLLVSPFIFMGVSASLAARNGITRVATDFLQFKAEELRDYATTQWSMLEENDLTESRVFVLVAEEAVASFARNMIRNTTELIFAVDSSGNVVMTTGDVNLTEAESTFLINLVGDGKSGWFHLTIGAESRVAQCLPLSSFGWYLLVTETQQAFYSSIKQIYIQSGIILAITAIISIILLAFFTHYLTRPLLTVVGAMREIITRNDLSKRVTLIYKDEIGELGHSFNLMTSQLGKAYDQVKSFALKSVLAEKRERKIRTIFQKFVPNDVIEQFFANPEDMLTGDNRIVALLFTDVRDFTRISEGLLPEYVVESLNRYLSIMVDIILKYHGTVDKYMGDAIMAFYGAPTKHDNDSLLAVQSGFDMLDAVKEFNAWQTEQGRSEFKIGVGVNYGVVTVGNIGSEKKMDYTVIGDMVNLASRLEDLTKTYKEPFLVSESVYHRIKDKFPCRRVDIVAVKGKSTGVKIYSPKKTLDERTRQWWSMYDEGLSLYYDRDFDTAAELFQKARKLEPEDYILKLYMQRCRTFQRKAPPEGWMGVTVLDHK
jgi:class 3 adenylate cyclase/HAMP domain-containing protein